MRVESEHPLATAGQVVGCGAAHRAKAQNNRVVACHPATPGSQPLVEPTGLASIMLLLAWRAAREVAGAAVHGAQAAVARAQQGGLGRFLARWGEVRADDQAALIAFTLLFSLFPLIGGLL